MTANPLDENRLVRTFSQLRQEGRKALMPFLTAGYPDLETTGALLRDLESRGVRVVELGIPFSDPIADGPTIQASYYQALEAGVRPAGIFEMVARYREDGGEMALLAMGSYSIVFRYGVQRYLTDAAAAGIDGLIIPDLPLDEAAALEQGAAAAGLCNVLLCAPTTPPERRYRIAAHSRGFVYFISVAGTTGERVRLPQSTIEAVADLRGQTELPICVGFGISGPDTVRTVCEVADGAIVGSAIIHRITDAAGGGRDAIVRAVGELVDELLEPLR